ncbi:PIN domain-containing protein [Natronorarus salvus]|uniref:hypothetical protein n=1 Tax=Natronorarus salvus TaxID=3117733 RepID=UPI002F26CA1B
MTKAHSTASATSITADDCIVAATALVVEETVVTRNGRHFERVEGLDIRTC